CASGSSGPGRLRRLRLVWRRSGLSRIFRRILLILRSQRGGKPQKGANSSTGESSRERELLHCFQRSAFILDNLDFTHFDVLLNEWTFTPSNVTGEGSRL